MLDEIDSTNAEAARRAAAGTPAPLWIMARAQTRGRGRRGRAWVTPAGNLSATLLMRPDWPPSTGALMSFAACLAVAEFFDAVAPNARTALKWPNDPLLNGRKAAGVLLESAGRGARLDWLAIGVGVNLSAAPPQEAEGWPATSVNAEAGWAPSPEFALAHVAASLADWSERLEAEGFAPLRAAWLARAARLGDTITARLPRETVKGVFSDIDETGALVLSCRGALRRIAAADVFFS